MLDTWNPEAGTTLQVKTSDNQKIEYTIGNVRQVAMSDQLWGSRTVVWATDIEARSDAAPELPNSKGMQLIIKSTWVPPHLSAHEQTVLEWIRREGKSEPRSHLLANIPIAVGAVLGTAAEKSRLKGWTSFDKTLLNSTMATFSVRATRTPKDVALHELWAVYRNLVEILELLSRVGIHYRDLHPGNVLITEAQGANRCTLIDFGNARILKARRGYIKDVDHPPEENEGNRQDCRSGNDFFMSRRVHELTREMERYDQKMREFPAYKRMKETARHGAALIANRSKIYEEWYKRLEDRAYRHRYVDDLESAIYLILYLVSARLSQTSRRMLKPSLLSPQ